MSVVRLLMTANTGQAGGGGSHDWQADQITMSTHATPTTILISYFPCGVASVTGGGGDGTPLLAEGRRTLVVVVVVVRCVARPQHKSRLEMRLKGGNILRDARMRCCSYICWQ